MRVCIVGASGKLGRYMVKHALDRGYEVVGVCREESVGKLDPFKGRITVIPGATDDRAVIERAVAGCDGVLVVLVPRGVHGYSTGTAQAVLDHAPAGRAPRVLLRMAHHARRPGRVLAEAQDDREGLRPARTARPASPISTTRSRRAGGYSPATRAGRSCAAATSRRARARACPCGAGTSATPSSRATSPAAWTSPCFMVAALENDELVHEAPAIVGGQTPSALAHAAAQV